MNTKFWYYQSRDCYYKANSYICYVMSKERTHRGWSRSVIHPSREALIKYKKNQVSPIHLKWMKLHGFA